MKKLMVIDDDIATRLAIKHAFADKFKLFFNEDGLNVVEEINQEKPDAVLLDIHLPGRQGLRILNDIRAEFSKLPVFMITVRNDEETIIKCFELGASDFISKPFSLGVLNARMTRWLSETESERSDIKLGKASLKLKSGLVTVDGNESQLNSRERMVISLLLQNPGQIISRQQILDFAWGYDYFGTSRTVDNVISAIRKKIKDMDSTVISSHRGMGYKLKK